MRESLSDEVKLDSLLLTDDGLSFRRPGIGPEVTTKLRRGHWAIQGLIDLHGLSRDGAREAMAGYLHECQRLGACAAWCTATATDRPAGSRC